MNEVLTPEDGPAQACCPVPSAQLAGFAVEVGFQSDAGSCLDLVPVCGSLDYLESFAVWVLENTVINGAVLASPES